MIKHETSRALTKTEYDKIINYCRKRFNTSNDVKRKFVYIRSICFYSLMWNIGCRPREAYGTLISDIDLINNSFYISGNRNKTKRGRFRKISLPLKFILIEYLQWRNKFFPKSKYLFPSDNINYIHRRTLQLNFKRILKKLNLLNLNFIDDRNIPRYTLNLYSFRKGHAEFLLEKTGRADLVKESLDHKNIETTYKFYIKTVYEKVSNNIVRVFNT